MNREAGSYCLSIGSSFCSLLAEISFLFAFTVLMSTGKRPVPWVDTHFDPTAVPNLGRHSSNRMPHDMFHDCGLNPLFPLFLIESTQHEVSREDLVAK